MKLHHWIGISIWIGSMAGMMFALYEDRLIGVVAHGFLMLAGVHLALHRAPKEKP